MEPKIYLLAMQTTVAGIRWAAEITARNDDAAKEAATRMLNDRSNWTANCMSVVLFAPGTEGRAICTFRLPETNVEISPAA